MSQPEASSYSDETQILVASNYIKVFVNQYGELWRINRVDPQGQRMLK